MGQILSRRCDPRPGKDQPPFDVNPLTEEGGTTPRVLLDSKLIPTKMPSHDSPKKSPQDEKKLDLGKLPAELWGMIFGYALAEEWNGTTPSFIKAMRAHKTYYPECMLAWYNQKHTYVLHTKNNWSFLNMPEEVIATIFKVEVIIDENVALHPLLRWSDMAVVENRLPMSVHDLATTAALAKSVTSVTLNCRPISGNLFFWYPSKFSIFFSGFKHLKYAATTCPAKPPAVSSLFLSVKDGYVDTDWQEGKIQVGIKEANSILGAVAKLDRVYADAYNDEGRRAHRKYEDREKWIWVAQEGKFLEEVQLPPGLQMAPDGSYD
ncbi:hypothetical protein BKA64DRAFT_702165 [Cadophora sp. MPI-SDFR-AT-0126]|nr:hypothetical protein BKA64DRAFT_702165 [Leotiomycetes sp. MPI-SDFR-AT-0126]